MTLMFPIKLRGKLRPLLLLTCVATAIFIIYKTLADEPYGSLRVNSPLREDGNDVRKASFGGKLAGPKILEDVNDLMPITQPREYLERMRQHEQQMMRNVQKIIQHRIKETSRNRTSGFNRPNSVPSLWSGIHQQNSLDFVVPKHTLKLKFVHLDLKGAPPTVNYFQHLFPFISKLGATGVLIEYEDMFPYWGKLDDVRAFNSYTRQDIDSILSLAAQHHLEVVPLIQAFGHMEFILKREGFASLREVPAFPQAICPSNNRSTMIIFEMIDQVLQLHPKIRHLHIGCDEVFNIGECLLCHERLEKLQWSTESLFLDHVSAVVKYIRSHHSQVQPLMWDDMFRNVPEELIRSSEIGKYTDIVVWKYASDVGRNLPADLWQKYSNSFSGIWIASAFKGAGYPATFATTIEERLKNHQSWMQVLEEYHDLVNIRGIFLTGWQRFDHFAVLCELLPAGLPSLAVNLQYLLYLKYDEDVQRQVQNLLDCDHPPSLNLSASLTEIQCSFPGSRIYELSLQFYVLVYNLNEQFFESNYIKGWVSDYNVKSKFSSPPLIEQAILRYGDAVRNVSLFQAAVTKALSEIYDKYTVSEWIEINIAPLLKRLDDYMSSMKSLLLKTTWPRRPISASFETDIKSHAEKTAFMHVQEP